MDDERDEQEYREDMALMVAERFIGATGDAAPLRVIADILVTVDRYRQTVGATGLDWEAMLKVEPAEMAEDVSGCLRHANPDGSMRDCFSPRFQCRV